MPSGTRTVPLSSREALEVLRSSVKWCPVHHQTDCAPLLNGCPRLVRQADALDVLEELVSTAEQEFPRGF